MVLIKAMDRTWFTASFCGDGLVSVLVLMVSFGEFLASSPLRLGCESDDWPQSYIAKRREKHAGIWEILSNDRWQKCELTDHSFRFVYCPDASRPESDEPFVGEGADVPVAEEEAFAVVGAGVIDGPEPGVLLFHGDSVGGIERAAEGEGADDVGAGTDDLAGGEREVEVAHRLAAVADLVPPAVTQRALPIGHEKPQRQLNLTQRRGGAK